MNIGALIISFMVVLQVYCLAAFIRMPFVDRLLQELLDEEAEWRCLKAKDFKDGAMADKLLKAGYMRLDSIGWKTWHWKIWLTPSELRETVRPVEEYYKGVLDGNESDQAAPQG